MTCWPPINRGHQNTLNAHTHTETEAAGGLQRDTDATDKPHYTPSTRLKMMKWHFVHSDSIRRKTAPNTKCKPAPSLGMI